MAPHVYAANYYVSKTGADINVGSMASPFFTIQHGLNTVLPGDTLLVRTGTYLEKLTWTTSGSSGQLITLINFAGESPVVAGDTTTGQSMLSISSKSYLVIKGLTFQNNYVQDAKGIYVVGEGEQISIHSCTLKNIGWTTDPNADPYSLSPTGQAHGILVNGRTSNGIHDILIADNRIHDIITGNSEALTLVGNVYDFEIVRDTIHDTKNIGIDIAGHYTWAVDGGVDDSLNQSRDGVVRACVVYENRRFSNTDAPPGIYTDGAKNVLITGNTVYRNGNGMSVGCENPGKTATNITVVNNVVYDNDNNGIYFGSNAAIIKHCVLKNNTFLENGNLGTFRTEVSLQNSDSCKILQNIFIPRSSSHYAVSIFGYTVTNLTVNNNLAYRYNGDPVNLYVPDSPAQFTPTNSMEQNPQFVDSVLTNPDLNLKTTSPAIDQGDTTYGFVDTLDVNVAERVVNGKLDHGAMEAQNGNCPDSLTIDNTMILRGTFTALNKVKFDINGASIPYFLNIFTPLVDIISPIVIEKEIHIDYNACPN